MQGKKEMTCTRRIERKLYLKLLDLMLTAIEPRHVSSIRVSRMNKLDHRMNLKNGKRAKSCSTPRHHHVSLDDRRVNNPISN